MNFLYTLVKTLHPDAIKDHCDFQRKEDRHKERKDDPKVKTKGKEREKQNSSSATTTFINIFHFKLN